MAKPNLRTRVGIMNLNISAAVVYHIPLPTSIYFLYYALSYSPYGGLHGNDRSRFKRIAVIPEEVSIIEIVFLCNIEFLEEYSI